MSGSFSQFFGGLPWTMTRYQFLTKSGVFRASRSGKLLVLVQGAAASGGAICFTDYSTARRATGGGCGETVWDVINVSAGDELTITLGAGGAAVTVANGAALPGNNGADTSVSGPNGYSLTVKGGKAGLVASGTASLTPSLSDVGSGGTPSVRRVRGSRAGAITLTDAAGVYASGAAAPNLWLLAENATRGGDITAKYALEVAHATGGGAIGGRGADLTTGATNLSGAASSGGNGVDNTLTSGQTLAGGLVAVDKLQPGVWSLGFQWAAGMGDGSVGVVTSSSGTGGLFAAPGGVSYLVPNGSSGSAGGGAPNPGSASAGVACSRNGSGIASGATAAKAGDAFAVIFEMGWAA